MSTTETQASEMTRMIKTTKEVGAAICDRKYIVILFMEDGSCYIEPRYYFEEAAEVLATAKSGMSAILSAAIYTKLDT